MTKTQLTIKRMINYLTGTKNKAKFYFCSSEIDIFNKCLEHEFSFEKRNFIDRVRTEQNIREYIKLDPHNIDYIVNFLNKYYISL